MKKKYKVVLVVLVALVVVVATGDVSPLVSLLGVAAKELIKPGPRPRKRRRVETSLEERDPPPSKHVRVCVLPTPHEHLGECEHDENGDEPDRSRRQQRRRGS